MAYATLDDLKAKLPEFRLAQLVETNGDALSAAGRTLVASALSEASAYVDGFLRGVYMLPLTPVPEVVRGATAALALEALFSRVPETELPEAVSKAAKAARDLCKAIRAGEHVLDCAQAGGGTVPGFAPLTNKTAADRVFGDDLWGKF